MTKNFWDAYGVDTDLMEDGVWIKDFGGGAEVKMRSTTSHKAREALRRLQEHPKYKVALQRAERTKEPMSIELQDELNREWMAMGILVDWRGIPDRATGVALPFSVKNAVETFKVAPHFYEDCWVAAGGRTQFLPANDDLAEAAKTDLGN